MDQFTIPESKALATQEVGSLWTRRKFLGFISWASFLGAVNLGLLSFVRFMYPRVLFEPSPIFKAGFPADYQSGEVSEKFKDSHRVWIVRTDKKADGVDGLYAILAICTHLGCTPRWLKAEDKFKCPCHGSGYYRNGVNFEGPAPRPMDHIKVGLADDGQIILDRSKKYPSPDMWETSDAFLKLS